MPNGRTARIIRKVIKSIGLFIVLLVNGILVWRLCSSGDPATMKVLTVNEPLLQAYEIYGDGITLQYQEQTTMTRTEKNYGYFGVTQCVFIPQANQVQIVFRYNNSTINHLADDYGLSEIPSKDQTLYDVTLVMTTDRTPENRDDNLDPDQLILTRYQPTSYTRDTTTLYTYYRYVFDGVSVDELTVGVFADIYYVEDIDYNAAPYGTLCLYDDESEWLPYKLTSDDKKALAEK
ncbi:MAG: hypothetical protein IJW92_04845 [Clostridia bacterium]|nr:hypothetical protein [Clostridia bacterium]